MRDFFYNKGDVLIAILIIAVAVVVIYFRVGVVMGDPYPGERLKSLLSPIAALITGDRGAEDAESADEAQPVIPAAEPPAQTEQPAQEAETAVEPPAAAADPPPAAAETPPVQQPAGEVKITVVAGDAASTIADKLLEAGAIQDKQAFLSEVDAQGAASRLKQGTFTIPAGSSINDIIKILAA